MTDATSMKLVFRLGEFGFALSIDDLAEIHQEEAGTIDPGTADPPAGRLGQLAWRGQDVEVFDLGVLLGLATAPSHRDGAILILCGASGFWGLAVGPLAGIFPDREFRSHLLPPLLEWRGALPFHRLAQWRNELLQECSASGLAALRGDR